MYICICKGISDKDLEQAMLTHHNTKDILKALGVGSECGVCLIDAIQNLGLKESAKSQNHTVQKPANSK